LWRLSRWRWFGCVQIQPVIGGSTGVRRIHSGEAVVRLHVMHGGGREIDGLAAPTGRSVAVDGEGAGGVVDVFGVVGEG
jgi:hypothetical protein